MSANIAIVKSVVSGDTVVLLSTLPPAAGQQPLEKSLSLAYVSAPRLKREGDEVCSCTPEEISVVPMRCDLDSFVD